MTLTAGFRCVDGFVIAADTEVTLGGVSFQGSKIDTYDRGAPDTLCIAVAGDVGYGLEASQNIRDAVQKLTSPCVSAIKETIAAVVTRIYNEKLTKLWAAGSNEGDFALIVGVEDFNRQFAVFRTSQSSVHEVSHFEFAGSGAQLAYYVAERLFGSAPIATAVTEHFARQLFREVKHKGIYVGGNTQVFSRRANAAGDQFFDLPLSQRDYRFLWGLDDAMFSAVRVALDHRGHKPLPGRKLPKRLESRLSLIRKRLTQLYLEASAERTNRGDERHSTEFDTEYGNPLKDL